jgi:2,4-dienoyl-CoA reductase-like NADH-dependent reductase (Old Yellow Enzyme family)/thioredoxin reductase
MNMEYRNLLSPYQIGGMVLKNRFVVPALATNYGDANGNITKKVMDYYITRAKGGYGLIVIEVVAVEPIGRAIPNQLGIWDDYFIPQWAEFIDELHKYGAKVAIQLHHAGRQCAKENIGGQTPVAPSAIPCPIRKEMPHELTIHETYSIIDQFATAARRAVNSGADAIELNGAHGYLIAQFMSTYANKRIDEFGGNFDARMMFPIKIIKRIRREVGNGVPIIFRMSGEEKVAGGRDLNESAVVAKVLTDQGIDAMSMSAGVYDSLEHMSAPSAFPPGHNVYIAEAIKKAVDIPVIIAGRINYPQLAEEVIRTGKADFVAIGRGSLADPEFPNKVAGGSVNEIAPCIGCLQGCMGYLFDKDKMKISCLVNPFVGKENEWKINKANDPKKIIVVGAGPAGLEFSWIAAKRGHQVICYEKESVVGGQFRIAGIPPTKNELLNALVYFKTMCDKYNVQFRMNTEFTKEMVRVEKPDSIILATGSEPLIPEIKGINNPKFINAIDLLDSKCMVGENVLVVGGGLLGAETADYIAERGSRVSIIESKSSIVFDCQGYVRKYLLERLRSNGVVCTVSANVIEFLENGVIYETTTSKNGIYTSSVKTLDGFDSVVLAMGSVSYNPLYNEINYAVAETHVIGDAFIVGKAITAISNAAECAISI